MADFGASWNFNRRDYGYDDRSTWATREADRVTGSSNALPYGTLSTDLINAVLGLGVSNTLDDPTLNLTSQLMNYELGLSSQLMGYDMAHDGLPPDAASTLFVDGLPSDCTRREAAHIFRPFIGFKEVRVVHKDAKRASGDKLVLCFVEFVDAKCAATALEALQGYKFDENDPDSYVLRLTFARYGPRGAATGARPRSPFRGRDRSPFRRGSAAAGGSDRRR